MKDELKTRSKFIFYLIKILINLKDQLVTTRILFFFINSNIRLN